MNNSVQRYVLIVLAALLLLCLQTSLLNPLPWLGIHFNFLFVLAVFCSVYATFEQRMFAALFCGLLIDFWFSSCSFYTISFIITCNVGQYIFSKFDITRFYFMALIFAGTLLSELLNAALLSLCGIINPINTFSIYGSHILLMILGNSLLALWIYPLFLKSFTEAD